MNLFAKTEITPCGGLYPAYISVNVKGEDVEFTVRSHGEMPSGSILLNRQDLICLYSALGDFLAEGVEESDARA